MRTTITPAEAAPLLPRLLAFAAVYLVWGSTYLGIRIAIETLPPFLMAGTRFFLAGVLLFLFARARGAPRPTWTGWKATALVGTMMLFGGNGLVTWAEQHIASGVAAVLVALVPLWMALFDWAFFGGPRPGRLTITGVTLGFSGVVVLMSARAGAPAAVDVAGGSVVVLASAAWAMGSLASRRTDIPASPMLAASMQMLTGGGVMLLVGSVVGEWSRVDVAGISTRSIVALAYLSVFGSIVTLCAYQWLLRHVSAASVSTYALVNPVVAVVLGCAFAGEVLDSRTAIASLLIVTAVTCLYRAGRKRKRGPRQAGAPSTALGVAEPVLPAEPAGQR